MPSSSRRTHHRPTTRRKAATNKQYQACAAQNIGGAERLVKEIEMKVRPDKTQAASLENLHKISSDMAKLLIASCAQPIPADPLARLDSASDQITAHELCGEQRANRVGRFLWQAVADTEGAVRGDRPLTDHMPKGTLALLLSVRLR